MSDLNLAFHKLHCWYPCGSLLVVNIQGSGLHIKLCTLQLSQSSCTLCTSQLAFHRRLEKPACVVASACHTFGLFMKREQLSSQVSLSVSACPVSICIRQHGVWGAWGTCVHAITGMHWSPRIGAHVHLCACNYMRPQGNIGQQACTGRCAHARPT